MHSETCGRCTHVEGGRDITEMWFGKGWSVWGGGGRVGVTSDEVGGACALQYGETVVKLWSLLRCWIIGLAGDHDFEVDHALSVLSVLGPAKTR
jgi:hypothetical protein